MCAPNHRKAAHRRPASAAVHSSGAASTKVGDIVGRPASLPVSHWSRHQRHPHATSHPLLRQDVMSTMRFSRPRSAQPWVSKHEEEAAAECSRSPRLKDKHVQSVSPMSFCAAPVQIQAHRADGLSSSLHNEAHEYSIAASTSVHQAPDGAALEVETVCEQSGQVTDNDLSKGQEVQLEHLESSCQPETSSHALSPDKSSLCVNRQDPTGLEQSMQQLNSKGRLGIQADSHSRTRMREQEWPPQGARWRRASQYKLQANPMHLPTAKVCRYLHALCLTSVALQHAVTSSCLLSRCTCCASNRRPGTRVHLIWKTL